MNIPRIMIAAPKSGSGKTLLTCALLEAFKEDGKKALAYKCGPDYIDPMFHQKVIGVSSGNLDSFFLKKEELLQVFCDSFLQEKGELAVLEGAMGLFDGLGGVSTKASAYEVAAITKTPVLLVIDAHGMGNSIVALIAGFLQYDTQKLIKGIILNHVTKSFYMVIKPLIEKELSMPVVGFFPYKEELTIESRHLGLQLPDEIDMLKQKVEKAAMLARESICMEKLLEIANEAAALRDDVELSKHPDKKNQEKVRIAVAKDEAFCFYYRDNLRLLEKYGALLVYFSPLHDKEVPQNIAGILLGGGYPELYAEQLSKNESMLQSLRACFAKKLPSLAECGGFMYLHENLIDQDGKKHKMLGIVEGDVRYMGKLVRFGYIDLFEKTSQFLQEKTSMKAHEFHYYDSDFNGDDCCAVKPITGKTWTCVHETESSFWGFPHLYYLSNPKFVQHFMKKAFDFHQSSSCTL